MKVVFISSVYDVSNVNLHSWRFLLFLGRPCHCGWVRGDAQVNDRQRVLL